MITSNDWLIVSFSVVFVFRFSLPARAQRISQIAPTCIGVRGISFGDDSHSMDVGDSASIDVNTSSDMWMTRTIYSRKAHCDKSHTFCGLSFYDPRHAIVLGDQGLICASSNMGARWKQLGAGIRSQTLGSIIHARDSMFVLAGDRRTVLIPTDSGAN